jgi:pimeloyl-ACP methyl ester carboxylesterase
MSRVDVNGVGIEYQVTGQGRPVVLLHGFPDSGRLWRHQVTALAGAGFQVIVPDLRGYGRSDKPEAVEAYSLALLAGDVIAVLAAEGIDRAHIVGHDWGAALAWALASFAPGHVDHLAVLSVGHPSTLRRTLEQRQKSWYMLLFQFEGVAEELLSRDDWALFREWLRGDGDVERYVADLGRPGALTAGLNWYRANLHPARELEPRPPIPPVAAPTLGVWSTGDSYLREEPMLRSAEHVTGPWRYERLEGAGHWMQLDATERLNALLVDFLR